MHIHNEHHCNIYIYRERHNGHFCYIIIYIYIDTHTHKYINNKNVYHVSLSLSFYIYIYIQWTFLWYIYIHIYIYIYICVCVCVCVCVWIMWPVWTNIKILPKLSKFFSCLIKYWFPSSIFSRFISIFIWSKKCLQKSIYNKINLVLMFQNNVVSIQSQFYINNTKIEAKERLQNLFP